MATVEVTFTPLPAHVRTARLVATAVARRSGVDEALLDEVRLAVGEACSRAVEAHQRHCPAEPVKIEMTDQGERFVVVVSDQAPTPGASPSPDPGASASASSGANAGASPGGSAGASPGRGTGANGRGVSQGAATLVQGADDAGIPAGFGLAVISGLADDVHVSSTSSGVSVRMSWPSAAPA
jgi:serine/threonine-protein kinase RsbW